jgi:hypothetical protein
MSIPWADFQAERIANSSLSSESITSMSRMLGTYVSLIDSAQWSSDLPPKIEIVGDCARWTAVRRDQLPPVADPFIEG